MCYLARDPDGESVDALPLSGICTIARSSKIAMLARQIANCTMARSPNHPAFITILARGALTLLSVVAAQAHQNDKPRRRAETRLSLLCA